MKRANMKLSAVCVAFCSLVVSVFAQPLVQPDFYDGRVPQRSNKIIFCVWPTSPMADLDRAIGKALANIQLFKPEFYEVKVGTSGTQEIFEQELFIHLMDHCDAALGTSLNWRPLPEWLTITASYYDMPYALVVHDPEVVSLGQLPSGGTIGSVMFSQADLDLTRTLQIEGTSRLVRVPYDTPNNILEAVVAGRLTAGIVPGYAIMSFRAQHPETEIHTATTSPMTVKPELLGIAVLSRDSYLRVLLDQAIAALKADGGLSETAEKLGFPVTRLLDK